MVIGTAVNVANALTHRFIYGHGQIFRTHPTVRMVCVCAGRRVTTPFVGLHEMRAPKDESKNTTIESSTKFIFVNGCSCSKSNAKHLRNIDGMASDGFESNKRNATPLSSLLCSTDTHTKRVYRASESNCDRLSVRLFLLLLFISRIAFWIRSCCFSPFETLFPLFCSVRHAYIQMWSVPDFVLLLFAIQCTSI